MFAPSNWSTLGHGDNDHHQEEEEELCRNETIWPQLRVASLVIVLEWRRNGQRVRSKQCDTVLKTMAHAGGLLWSVARQTTLV